MLKKKLLHEVSLRKAKCEKNYDNVCFVRVPALRGDIFP